MPFYGREFYGDENVLVMTLEQEGAYLRLLWNCWQEGSIPEDTTKLAAMCKNSPVKRFEREIWPTLGCLFVARDGGRLVHQKVELLRAKKEDLRAKWCEGARLANEKRWGKDRSLIGGRPDSERMEIPAEYRIPNTDINTDLDCVPTNHQNRDSSARDGSAPSSPSSPIRQYPGLREMLHRCFREPGCEDLYPSDRLVADVMDAAGGEPEGNVIACLEYLHEVRGLKPGTKNGPRQWSWFKTVVQDYFARKREREENSNPCGHTAWADRNEVRLDSETFDNMLEAIELPDRPTASQLEVDHKSSINSHAPK